MLGTDREEMGMIGKELDRLRPCPICGKPPKVVNESIRSAGGLKTPLSKLLSITIGCKDKEHVVTVKATTIPKAVSMWEYGQR